MSIKDTIKANVEMKAKEQETPTFTGQKGYFKEVMGFVENPKNEDIIEKYRKSVWIAVVVFLILMSFLAGFLSHKELELIKAQEKCSEQCNEYICAKYGECPYDKKGCVSDPDDGQYDPECGKNMDYHGVNFSLQIS